MSTPVFQSYKAMSLLAWERRLWDAGVIDIAGIDEVGRGALAGPLVAAAIVLPDDIREGTSLDTFWSGVRDSKTLSFEQRQTLAIGIRARAKHVSLSAVESSEIDAIGLGPANRAAMERAVYGLPSEPDWLLIDALTLDVAIPQFGVIDGDALSLSVAAASIVAKHARDEIMIALARQYPSYSFDAHKGYGVAGHLIALGRHGPCPAHRVCFAPVQRALESHRAGH